MFLQPAVIHDVAEEDSWPGPVKKLASQLREPLPGYASSASHLQNLQIVAGLPYELEANTRTSELMPSSQTAPTTLNDVLTFVLSIVASVRHATADSDAIGIPRHISPLIYTLFLALSHFDRDACRLSQVPFILPRIKGVAMIFEDAAEDALKVDGIATFLSCIAVPQCDQPSNVDTETTQKPDHPATDRILSMSEESVAAHAALYLPSDDEDEEMVEDRPEMSRKVTVPVLDVPFDAHVLPGRGLRSCAVLPILAVADLDNIEPLLCSILYQRFVWGIDEPVVGFAVSEFDPNLPLYFGWIDIQNNKPIVNICRPSIHVAFNPAIGLFNMADPYSACVLAQFLLSLQSQYDAVKESAAQLRFNRLCWRSDHRDDDEQALGGIGSDQNSRVPQWLQSLPRRFDSSNDKIIHSRRATIHVCIKSETNQDVFQEDTVSSDELNEENWAEASPNWLQYREDIDSQTSYISASSTSFVVRRRSPQRRDDEFLFAAWHTERNVAMIGQMYQDNKQPDCHEINEMVDLYRSTLQFAWPKEWDNLA
ncbi:unnamed protein product [Somion occarium]|uniref:Uncharacterized protein n=1 Tax=Somion occarium TaxID=3059160 RepID=A0ABP1DWS7_9APHY